MKNIYFFLKSLTLFFVLYGNAFADNIFTSKQSSFLKTDEAFILSIKETSNEKTLINFEIAKGYYLYKDKIKIFRNNEELVKINFPDPEIKEDEFFGKSEIYDKTFTLQISLKEDTNFLEIHYQGCAEKGLCYPPNSKKIKLKGYDESNDIKTTKVSKSEIIYDQLSSNSIFINIFLFIGFGLLLSFTPCVLPMVPILSSLILKSNSANNNKPYLLSLYYVFGMCILYTLVGLFVGYSANIYNIQSAFQDPLYLIFFIFILVALSFSMFGLYEIKIANSFQKWVVDLSNKIYIGGYGSALIMGFLSALIVGPCVAPPLAGIFIYVTSENPGSFVTGLLFLSLAIGMSIPLLIYGTFMNKFIPKTGKWMKYINYLIGILLLIVAVTFIDRLIPVLTINNQESNLVFKKANNIRELNELLNTESDNIIFLDVYADWCIECKLMERKTFTDKTVEKYLKEFSLVKIDVTDNTKQDIEMLKYLNIVGPPAYKFFTSNGIEIKGFGIQGYMNAKDFKKHIEEIKKH